MVLKVSAKSSRELRAVLLAIKASDRETRKQIRQRTRAVALPEWKQALAGHAQLEQDRRLIVNTARINVTDRGVRVRAAFAKRRALSGGATPFNQGKAFEFGSNTFPQLPKATRAGRVFYPAAADMIPRILALWTQTTVRTIAEALEGKR